MQMTESEIIRRYKSAKDPVEQICILAQLNATSEDEIRRILLVNGQIIPEKKRKRGRPKAMTPETMKNIPATPVSYVTKKKDEKPTEIPEVILGVLTEKYHELLEMKECYLDTLRKLEEKIDTLEQYIKGAEHDQEGSETDIPD